MTREPRPWSVVPHAAILAPIVFAPTAGLLLVVAALACLLPIRRALAIDPMATLRYQ